MIKVGLKLWNINTQNYLPLLCDLYQEKWFDYIELYIVPGHIDTLALWKKVVVPFDIHAPHSAHAMNLSLSEKWDSNCTLYQEVKQFADTLNARYIIFHGGTDGSYLETAIQLKRFSDPRILIENKPYKVLDFIQARSYVGTQPNEIQYIHSYVPCGVCLDIGHAICSANSHKVDPYAYIKSFMELNPQKLHLSDLDITTEIDSHLHIGQGTVNFDKLLPVIKEVGDVTLETTKDFKDNLNDFKEDVKALRRFICN